MTVTFPTADPGGVVSPRDSGLLAELKAFLAGRHGRAVLTTADGASAELPEEVYEVISQAVDALACGSAVTVAPVSAKLTTTQAAEVLGVSRPTLIKMLDSGKIPFEQLNVHRTLRLADVLAFRERRRIAQKAALDDLTRQGAEDGLYKASYADYAEALDDARHRGAR
ncbi:MAG: helix-turn-helix domain-containing protein [Bifidobacteriaceae bacterium]|nr:helix-turn-helix domain-containing protein [Bifidobacteriaceae bacterium]